MENLREREIYETKEFFANIGLSKELQEKATEEIAQDKKQWVDFMMKYELGLEKPDPKRASKSALNIGLSYIAGNMNIPEGNTENKIAYLIGRNFSFLAGFILLLVAFFIHRKVNRKRKKEMIDSFLK